MHSEDPRRKLSIGSPYLWHQQNSSATSPHKGLDEMHSGMRYERYGHAKPVLQNSCNIFGHCGRDVYVSISLASLELGFGLDEYDSSVLAAREEVGHGRHT